MTTTSRKLSTSSFYLFALATVPAFFLIATSDVFNTPKAVLLVALVVGTFVHFKVSGISRESNRFEKQISILLLLLTVGLLVASLASDTTIARVIWGYPGRANGLLYFLAILVALYLGMKLILESNFRNQLNKALNASFIIILSYSLIQFLDLDPIPWSNSFEIIGTFGNPNFAGAFLGVVTFFYFYHFLHLESKWRFASLTLAIVSGFLTVQAGSVQGPAIIVITSFILLSRFVKGRLPLKVFVGYLISSAFAAVFTFASLLGYGVLGDSLYQYTLRLRLDYWWIGIKTGLNWPITGVGTDSYVEGFKLLRGQAFADRWGASLTSDSAHSAPLNFLANFGFINFSLLLILIFAISVRALKVVFSKDEGVYDFALIVSIMWFGMLVQSLFSIEQIGLGVFQWLLGGILLNRAIFEPSRASRKEIKGKNTESLQREKRGFAYEFRGEISIFAIVVSGALLFPVLREDMVARDLLSTNISQSTPKELLDEKIGSLSYISRQEVRRGVVYSNALLQANRIDEAEKFLIEIVEKDSQAIEALLSLARIQRFYNRIEKEIEYREQIAALDPWDYPNKLSLVEAYLALQNINQARELANQLSEIAPNTLEAESATALVNEKLGK
jgi:hypothetical protein